MDEELEVASIPANVARFSWSAFLFPVLWPLLYHVPWLAAVAFFVPIAVRTLARLFVVEPTWGAPVLENVATIATATWVGFRANERFWTRHPDWMSVEDFAARQRGWIVWGLVFTAIALGWTLAQAAGLHVVSGSGSAAYAPIATPSAIHDSDVKSLSVVSASLGGWMTPVQTASKKMVRDAGGAVVTGDARETQANTLILVPRWPFVVSGGTWGWGTPNGSYRLDVDLTSAPSIVNYKNPSVRRGITVGDVAKDRNHVELVFRRVLAASNLDGVYDARVLARGAKVNESWQGHGVVSIAAILPKTSRVANEGSLVVVVGRDWQIENLSVWTDDTFAYQDAVNPNPTNASPTDLLFGSIP